MTIHSKYRFPFIKLLENLEAIAASDVDYRAQYAKGLLNATAVVPETARWYPGFLDNKIAYGIDP